ncbi:hypothetical protein [Winogradskyella flava]|uniref:hypothetical protein n=1 Tax=Winogradskyella flava TaxID=1884876 RepID=UPI0024905F13|nr:hypothetical protein [Winogradskyella flava]
MGRHRIVDFLNFLLQRVYESKPIEESFILDAFNKVVKDVNYHFPTVDELEIIDRITTNQNELALFLFRIGRELHLNNKDNLKAQIHFLMKDLCGCEIYFNSSIDTGFCIVHGEGTVIGSRNTIGKGFVIHQNCTVGHKVNGAGVGNVIGDNVKMYCNSSILGELKIGDDVTIGAHTMVNKNVKSNRTVVSTSRLEYL